MPADDTRRLITRRRSLQMFGTGAGLWIAGTTGLGSAVARTVDGDEHVATAAAATKCTLIAEQEEGPFYVALDQVREDIADGQTGIPLALQITIINSLTCKPLKNAAVDIWHCNASGVYSDITSESTYQETFLRGVQITDTHGQAHFTTIFPGHYSGRTTHIHARIHINSHEASAKITGGHICHTGQMFPPESVYEEVYALSPYNAETATVVTHAEDRVWTGQHGSEQQMTMKLAGSSLQKGLTGTLTMAVNPKATPTLIGATSTKSTVDGGGGGGTTGSGPAGTPPATAS